MKPAGGRWLGSRALLRLVRLDLVGALVVLPLAVAVAGPPAGVSVEEWAVLCGLQAGGRRWL